MKLLSIVVWCGSCDRAVVEEGSSLVAQPPARGRKGWRPVAARCGGNVATVADWRPGLSSISEDDQGKQLQKEVYCKESQMVKRKIESCPKPRTRQYDHHYLDHVRPTSFSGMCPAVAPSPFMF